MARGLSRRRFIRISAAAAALPLVPFGRTGAAAELVTWRGLALGGVATLQIHHTDRRAAERLIERSVGELSRLEAIFSLYRENSVLNELNRRGVVVAPPTDLVHLLEECGRYERLTGGRFDPTVQPLWRVLTAHFGRPDAAPDGPAASELEAARRLVGWKRVLVSPDRVALSRRGMALTLNGVAQGYVTDRVADLLRVEGVTHTLIDLGETRTLGARPDGRPWRVGLDDPERPDEIMESIGLADQALATSSPYGFRFDPVGRFNHLFDPTSGASAARYRSVTVIMPTATAADALSTAFSFLSVAEIHAVLRTLGDGRAYLMTNSSRFVIGDGPKSASPAGVD